MSLISVFFCVVCAAAFLSASAQNAGGKPNDSAAELYVQTGHSRPVAAIAFSPDGKFLASGSADKTVRLYDAATSEELRTFVGYKSDTIASDADDIRFLTFSSNGKIVSSVTKSGIIRLWNVETGEVVGTSATSYTGYFAAAFAPDGNRLATAFGSEVKISSVAAGDANQPPPKEVQEMIDQMMKANPNAKPSDFKVKYDLQPTVAELHKIKAHTGTTYALAFAPDGKILATSGADKAVKLWNAETGESLHTLPHKKAVFFLSFSPDGKILATLQPDDPEEIRFFETGSGAELKTSILPKADSMAFADNATLAVRLEDGKIQYINVADGAARLTFEAGISSGAIAFSPDKKILATADELEKTVCLRRAETGELIYNLSGRVRENRSLRLSPNGKRLANSGLQTIDIWDLESGQKLNSLSLGASVYAVGFSPDGKFLASGEGIGIGGGKPLGDLKYGDRINLQLGGESATNRPIRIWSVETGREVQILAGHASDISAVVFSNDGKFLFSGDYSSIKIWDAANGKLLHEIRRDDETVADLENLNLIVPRINQKQRKGFGFGAKVYSSFQQFDEAATPDGKLKIQITENGKLEITEAESKKLLATLIATDDGEWLVVAPDGLFDGTPRAWKSAVWRLGGGTFNRAPVEAFFKEFYYPGLLQEIMSGKSPKASGKDLNAVDVRQPLVKIVETAGKPNAATTDERNARVVIEIADNVQRKAGDFPASSGAADLRLFRNGSLVRLWERDVFALGEADNCRQIPAANNQPRQAVCETILPIVAGRNEFTAYAFNHDNVKSDDATAAIIGAENLKRRGKINILTIGVNLYQNKHHNLKFAVPDAVDFGAELRKHQLNLKNYDAPEAVQLTNAEATKHNILYALERFAKGSAAQTPENLSPVLKAKLDKIEKTQPEDALVIYFAGHGTARCEYDEKTKQTDCDRFFLIPHDGFPVETVSAKKSLDALYANSISDLELETVVRDLDAGELLLVVDACNSGQALESAEKRRGPMNSKGLAQLAFEKGMSILTAAQSFQAALEVSRTSTGKKIEHGLLTYSLLEGLTDTKADRNADKKIAEREWLNFAVGKVPQMQIEAMRKRDAEIKRSPRGKRSGVVFINGGNSRLPPEERGLQTPRVFYRRETSAKPLIVAAQ